MAYRIGFIGNFEVSYSTENDRKKSFEKLGHEVITFQENKTTIDEIHAASKGDLDVIFYSHTHGWEIPHLKAFFEACKVNGLPTASVHLDRWAMLKRESDIGKEATWFTEYIFMADGSPEAAKLYETHKLNWYFIKPGVLEEECFISDPNHERFPHEIIFVGSYGYHPEYLFRPRLIDWLTDEYGERFGHYGGDGTAGGTIRGKDLNTLYSSAKIVIGDSCFGGRPYYWSDRVTETMGRGGFLLHPYCEGMGDMPITSYTHNKLDDLKAMINFYLEHEKEREFQRMAGHTWVKKHETYTNRAQEMLDIIFK